MSLTLYLVGESPVVPAAALEAIASACTIQLARDVAPAWGREAWSVIVAPSLGAVPPGAPIVHVLKSPDVANALGYHDEGPGGVPYARIFTDPIEQAGGAWLTGDTSLSSVASHEICELFGDPTAQAWRAAADGSLYALELCDPCESDSYAITTSAGDVMVSNFVTPAYFDAQAASGPYDFLGKLSGPFTLDAGGYLIVQKAGTPVGQPTQITGEKRNPAFRAARTSRVMRVAAKGQRR